MTPEPKPAPEDDELEEDSKGGELPSKNGPGPHDDDPPEPPPQKRTLWSTFIQIIRRIV